MFDVANNIEVTPYVSAFDVRRRIEDALKRNARVDPSGIRVNVEEGGKVILEGRVIWSDRSVAERAAWSVPGVKIVDDRSPLPNMQFCVLRAASMFHRRPVPERAASDGL